jgi:hypothetical protein
MTQPGSLELLDRQDRRAIRREDRLADQITAPLRQLNTELQRELTRLYVTTVGNLDDRPTDDQSLLLRAAVASLLARFATEAIRLMVEAVAALIQAATDSVDFGLRLAEEWLGRHVDAVPYLDAGMQQALADLRARAQQDLAAAQAMAHNGPLRRHSDLVALAAMANKAANRVDNTARWLTNRGGNHGVDLVALQLDAEKLWIAERDACLTCLAYSGHTVEAMGEFPAGLTFGDKSTVRWPIPGPPAHPNCRCRLQVWLGSEEGVGPVEMPEALRREAQRSVARGWSEYASEPARLRAASRLVQQGATLLPKSVIETARDAVLARTFAERRLSDLRPVRGRVPRIQRVPPWGRPHIQRAR